MISLSVNQVTTEISALFDSTKPTMPRAFSVLEGITHGQILVDNTTDPIWAVVRDGTFGTLYFGGQVDAQVVSSLVDYFRVMGEVGIGCWLDNELNSMIPNNCEYDGRTLYFTERTQGNKLQNIQLSSDYTLMQRNQALFEKSFDYESTLAAFETIENVMRHTLGVVILYNDQVVCEAATGAPTHGMIEVGVTTHEAHRQRGLAFAACARLIEVCEAQGYKTWWDCAKQNIASTRLARKLGYQNEREYRYVWWNKK